MAGPRRNKSHKVPNVKLRPAIPSTNKRATTNNNQKHRRDSGFDDLYLNDSDQDDRGEGNSSDLDTSYAGDLCPRPFKGVILCATGISDKTTLYKQAIELGAQSLSDLTDRVTHLIAEEPGSAKYKCALENGLPIMKPSWIYESHKVWLRGDDVDFNESVRQHRLLPFDGLTLALTGFASVARRTEIHKLVTQNGGEFVKNIERPVRVTHLICCSEGLGNIDEGGKEKDGAAHEGDSRETSMLDKEPLSSPMRTPTRSFTSMATSPQKELDQLRETSPKVLYAEKFNARREASIQIVWEEWFWDSLRCGGRWEESGYKVGKVSRGECKQRSEKKMKRREKGKARAQAEPSSSAAQPPQVDAPSSRPAANANAGGAEAEEDEVASVKRVPAVKLAIWGSLMKSRGFEVSGGKLVRSPSKSQSLAQARAASQLPELEDSPTKNLKPSNVAAGGSGEKDQEKEGAKRSLLASFQRSKSAFAPASKDVSTPKDEQQPQRPLKRVLTSTGLQPYIPPRRPPLQPLPDTESSEENSFFGGKDVLSVGGVLAELGNAADYKMAVDDSSNQPLSSFLSVQKAASIRQEQQQPEAGPSKLPENIPQLSPGLFAGKTFRILGEARSPAVRSAITGAGGRVLGSEEEDEDDEKVDYVLVRLVSGSVLYHAETVETVKAKFRTECWLERCLSEGRIVDEGEHISFRPLDIRDPVQGVEEVNLSFSGLCQSEACWLQRLARALGFAIAPNFSRRTTHLLCPSRNGLKYEKAQEWRIPVVGMEWIEEMVRIGSVPVVEGFGDVSEGGPNGPVEIVQAKDTGKGKMRADAMVDITN
ncbi:hypothetical protein K474DRAFT_1696562, partial [Panus rudis PR-1116 ss-1]